MVLDKNIKAFVIHVTFFNLSTLIRLVNSAKETQIFWLIAKKVKILAKYSNFLDDFLKKKALLLLKITNLNQYAIKLQKSEKPSYKAINNFGLVELKTLKIYIETNFANGFIWPFKSLDNTFIFFV